MSSFVCDQSYAAASVSTTTGGGYGFAVAFDQVNGNWQVIGSGNLLPPNIGLPPDVYTQLNDGLTSSAKQVNIPI
jgi:hypothetical protein